MRSVISFVAGFAAGITYATGKEQPWQCLKNDLYKTASAALDRTCKLIQRFKNRTKPVDGI